MKAFLTCRSVGHIVFWHWGSFPEPRKANIMHSKKLRECLLANYRHHYRQTLRLLAIGIYLFFNIQANLFTTNICLLAYYLYASLLFYTNFKSKLGGSPALVVHPV